MLLTFSKIAIVQSLRVGEMQTGTRLREDLDAVNAFHQRGIAVSFHDVSGKSQLLACLTQLQQEAVHGVWPLLHIECHGADDTTGIVLADGSFAGWAELKPYLTTINVATQCNLLIVLGACYGGYLGRIILPTDRAPCWGMIGPTERAFPDELLSGYVTFYTELLASLDGDRSLQSLMSSPMKTGRQYFTTARQIFKLAYAKYLRNFCTPPELDKRAKNISRRAKKMNLAFRPGKGAVRRRLKREEGAYYEKCFREFFMIDLYPQNIDRFSLPFAEMKSFEKSLPSN